MYEDIDASSGIRTHDPRIELAKIVNGSVRQPLRLAAELLADLINGRQEAENYVK
jgi:hypothetical protein